jgi:hypothetical protein
MQRSILGAVKIFISAPLQNDPALLIRFGVTFQPFLHNVIAPAAFPRIARTGHRGA